MDRIARTTAALAGVSVLAFAAGIFLAGVNAASGWYYVVGLFLAGLGVLRIFSPTVRASVHGPDTRKRVGQKESAHRPSPIG